MIKINVDEAYAFDYYTILCLKKKNGLDVDIIIKIIEEDLINQIGLDKFNLIVDSEEYSNLYDANEKTFLAVDKAKTDDVPASYVDKCNYERMKHKQFLQSKFFSKKITEVKLGYEKLKK